MKILYINPLRTDITLTLLDEGIVEEVITLERGDDFAKFPETVISILHEKNPEEIWFLLGPGPFTRMRIITLTLSTLIFSRSIRVKGCHFFDLIDIHHPILRANDQEYIISDSSSGTRLILVEDIPGGTYMGYGEKNDFTDGRDYIEYIEDWGKIGKLFDSLPWLQILTPIYLKEPHITGSKKNTSPSSERTNI